MSRRLRVVVGIVVSVLFLFLAMRSIEWPKLWVLFREAAYLYLLPAFLVLAGVSVVRAYRWRLLMGAEGHLPLGRVFHFVNIGYSFNNVLPAKAGELVRAYLAGRLLPGGIGQALSTLLIERLLDVLAVVVLTVVLIPLLASQGIALPGWASRAGLLFGAVAIMGTAALLVLSRFGARGVEWVWRVVGRIPLVGHPKLKAGLQGLLNGFGVLTQGRVLVGAIWSSVLVWCGYALLNYLLMMVFGMAAWPAPPAGQGHGLSVTSALFVLCATGYSMIVPSSPGAMGVFEWAAVQALAVYGVEQSQAFGYALGLHVFSNVVLIVLGLLGLLREGLSYADIRRKASASQS